ncbi:MAG: histidinol-phosphate transaminase [Bdellovibrionota bacterium]|nr:histidinol-phosphate transaminase [Pseudobdellovibrionaceae bacterium]|tara:strand:- start:11125 stop:12225 length:1101 start_codon:yes stop_codon:yes gene_type:complete
MQVSDNIENLKPYVPGKPIEETKREYGLQKVFKLASNENPLGPSEKVLAAIQKASLEIHRYPDAGFYDLRQAFAKEFAVEPLEISFGNGSNELIDLLIRLYCKDGDKILTLQSAFIAYQISAQAAGVETDFVSLKPETLKIDVEDLIKAWKPEHKIVFLPNPNNPTGTYLNQKEMEKVIHFFGGRDDVVLVFDEAYVEYADAADYVSALRYRAQYENLVVLRTLSKAYGLAGLRVGAVFADKKVINYLDRIRNPFNVNSLAQAAALAALGDKDYLAKAVKMNSEGKQYFYKEFESAGISYWPSQANFVLFDCKTNAAEVVEDLLKKGVIVRPVANYKMPNYIRLSIGTEEENQKAIKEIKEILGSK